MIGQNVYTEAEPSPLQEGEDGGILRVDPAVEAVGRSSAVRRVARRPRRAAAVDAALEALRAAARGPGA